MPRKRTTTRRWDDVRHIEIGADAAAYLEAALEDGDASVVSAALGDIARAQGMTTVARKAGLGRESLYRALCSDGNPELATVLRVIRALGLRLHAEMDKTGAAHLKTRIPVPHR